MNKLEGLVDVLFQDTESGEEFFVELDCNDFDTEEDLYECAMEIATENFESPEFIDVLPRDEAEMLGLDTY